MATLKDVAREAGVSIASASHALNGTKPVSDGLRRRVLDASERIGYVPHHHARTLRTGRSRTFGALLPDLSNPFFPALLRAVCDAASRAGYGTLVADSGVVGESDALERLVAHRVDALVWVPVGEPATLPDIPTVTIDRPVTGCDGVTADHAAAGALIARHLREVGRTRPAILRGPSDVPSARQRARGFAEAWEGEVAFDLEVPFDLRLPAAARAALGDPSHDFDSVVCANDAVALGVLRELSRLGLRVPEDVAVVGVDDIALAELAEPTLTTVRQPVDELGREAVRLLIGRLTGSNHEPTTVTLPVTLVTRRSSPASVGSGAVRARSA